MAGGEGEEGEDDAGSTATDEGSLVEVQEGAEKKASELPKDGAAVVLEGARACVDGGGISLPKLPPPKNAAPLPNIAAAGTSVSKPLANDGTAVSNSVSNGPSKTEAQKQADKLGMLEVENKTMKVRSMYEMVEHLPSRTGRGAHILFLTNYQADVLRGDETCIAKLIEAFEIPPPRLIIQLLFSPGGLDWYNSLHPNPDLVKGQVCEEHLGVKYGCIPWKNNKEANLGEVAMARFMKEVLIPIAAENQALVVCSAIRGECLLSDIFNEMLQEEMAKWGSQPPLSVLGSSAKVDEMYRAQAMYKSDGGQRPWKRLHWPKVMKGSKNWKSRDKEIRRVREVNSERIESEGKNEDTGMSDLNPNIMNYIVADTIEGDEIAHASPLSGLMNQIVRYFLQTLGTPSITLKTGMSYKDRDAGASEMQSSLQMAMSALLAGSPLLFLDLRARDWFTPELIVDKSRPRRDVLISSALEAYSKYSAELMDKPEGDSCANTLDVMTIAFFFDVLFHDGYYMSQKVPDFGSDGRKSQIAKCADKAQAPKPPKVSLHETILMLETNAVSNTEDVATSIDGQTAPEASHKQVEDCVQQMSEIIFGHYLTQDLARLALEGEQGESKMAEAKRDMEKRQSTWALRAETLLKNRIKFWSSNVHDVDGCRNVVERLVRLDRLPKANNLRGLRLLQQAWDEHDVCMHYASAYKIFGKIAFFMQLFFMLLTIGVTVVLQLFQKLETDEELCLAHAAAAAANATCEQVKWGVNVEISEVVQNMEHSIFLVPIISGAVTAMLGYSNPTQRWRHLRRSACDLRSTIWLYRTRVGPFAVTPQMSSRAEDVLMEALNESRDTLVSGSDLGKSAIDQKLHLRNNMFKHQQHYGNLTSSQPSYPWWEACGCKLPHCLCPCRRPMQVMPEKEDFDDHEGIDDHHSPCNPEAYIQLRLVPMKEFFQKRIPVYSRRRVTLNVITMTCAALAAVLAYFSYPAYVVWVTAFSGAVLSWMEFTDVEKKLERYTTVVRCIKKHMSWWSSLSSVDRSSIPNITRLVVEGEQFISGELQAWSSLSDANRTEDFAAEEGSGNKSKSGSKADGGKAKA